MTTNVWQIVLMLMWNVKENVHANQYIAIAQSIKTLIILFKLYCTSIIFFSNLGSTNQSVELMEKHMPTNVKQGVQMLMWTVKGYVLAVLVVTMVRATFLSMDKLT